MLKSLIKRRNNKILSIQLFMEKYLSQGKIKKNYDNFDKIIMEIKKKNFNLKMIKIKCEQNYINKNMLEKEINKENFLHNIKKAEIIEKIFNYKILIINNKNKKNELNKKYNIDESTIINDSYFFENESDIIDLKDSLNITEKKSSIINLNLIYE